MTAELFEAQAIDEPFVPKEGRGFVKGKVTCAESGLAPNIALTFNTALSAATEVASGFTVLASTINAKVLLSDTVPFDNVAVIVTSALACPKAGRTTVWPLFDTIDALLEDQVITEPCTPRDGSGLVSAPTT